MTFIVRPQALAIRHLPTRHLPRNGSPGEEDDSLVPPQTLELGYQAGLGGCLPRTYESHLKYIALFQHVDSQDIAHYDEHVFNVWSDDA